MNHNEFVAILSTLFYVSFALFFYINQRQNVIGNIVTIFYAIISAYSSCLLLCGKILSVAPLSVLSSFYIFICYIIIIRPFRGLEPINNDDTDTNILYSSYKSLFYLCNVYIIVTILYELSYGTKAINNYLLGNWQSVYYQMRGEDAVYYNSLYEKLLINFVNYLRVPTLISAFILYVKKIKYKWVIVALIAPFLTALTNAVYACARSDLFLVILQYSIVFLSFVKLFDKKQLKKLLYVGFPIVFVAYTISSLITGSRFEGDSQGTWIEGYFGEPQMTGNIIVTYTESHYCGGHIAQNLYSLFGIPRGTCHMPVDVGFAFQTLIATRFMDFGYIGTLVYFILLTFIVRKMIFGGEMNIARLYIVVIYTSSIIIGSFYETNSDLTFVMIVLIYFILKKHFSYVKL